MNAWDRPDYQDTVRSDLLHFVPENVKTVLDIGCNRGAFGYAVKTMRDAEVWGVEPDPVSAAVAKERLDHVVVDIFHDRNEIPDGYFDLIVMNDSLEHMPDSMQALSLCKRKLKPTGRINCCVPNLRHVDNLEHILFEGDFCYEEQGIRDRTHLRFFTRKSIVRLFKDAGFKVTHVSGINETWWEPEKKLRRLIFRMFPEFTSDMRHVQWMVTAELP